MLHKQKVTIHIVECYTAIKKGHYDTVKVFLV